VSLNVPISEHSENPRTCSLMYNNLEKFKLEQIVAIDSNDDQESNLKFWNLCALANPVNLKTQHKKKKHPVLEELSCRFLDFTFADVDGKNKFEKQFKAHCLQYGKLIEEYKVARDIWLAESNKPTRTRYNGV
jgi:hypothetical protein